MTGDRAALSRRVVSLLDLTDLSDGLDGDGVRRLCDRAFTPLGPVAAVCLWSWYVRLARALLAGTPVRIATVVNFPAGASAVDTVTAETRRALDDGADEIDLVLPWRALVAGDAATARMMVAAVRAATPASRLLKVILETGELASDALIAQASDLAISEGADFIKTSTGKTAVSATPEAVTIMLAAINKSGRPVGLKPSGGIRTLDQAKTYLDLAESVLGPEAVTPARFRFGASGLLDAALSTGEAKSGY